MINYIQPRITEKPTWRQVPRDGLPYRVSCYDIKDGYLPPDAVLDLVQTWVEDNRCGKRMSYDTWEFKLEQDMMRFLLRWS